MYIPKIRDPRKRDCLPPRVEPHSTLHRSCTPVSSNPLTPFLLLQLLSLLIPAITTIITTNSPYPRTLLQLLPPLPISSHHSPQPLILPHQLLHLPLPSPHLLLQLPDPLHHCSTLSVSAVSAATPSPAIPGFACR